MKQSTLSLIMCLFLMASSSAWIVSYVQNKMPVISAVLSIGLTAGALVWFYYYIKYLRKESNFITNRKVSKAKFLYYYIIFGSIAGLTYFILTFIIDMPARHWALTPAYLLIGFTAIRFAVKNWKLIWMYVTDMERGKLLMYIDKYTHWSEEHKMKVVRWVYLGRRRVRQETYAKLSEKLMNKEDLTKAEQKKLKYRSVYCPQQIKDSFNEAILVHVLIYAHRNIQVLDDDLREIMNLTDEHILAFNLSKEREKATSKKYQKMMDTGKKAAERLKKK